jgi:hypothetical protein
MKEESRRIEGAILPTKMLDAVQWIATVIQAEHPADRLVLCGPIREHADKLVKEIKQRL